MFRFPAQSSTHSQTCLDDSDIGVTLSDSASVVRDDDGRFGCDEFYNALLAMPGVDPKLVSRDWFDNHYRWIVWKLAAYEIHFPETCAGR